MNRKSFFKTLSLATIGSFFTSKILAESRPNKIGFIHVNDLPVGTYHSDWSVIDNKTGKPVIPKIESDHNFEVVKDIFYADDINGFYGGIAYIYWKESKNGYVVKGDLSLARPFHEKADITLVRRKR